MDLNNQKMMNHPPSPRNKIYITTHKINFIFFSQLTNEYVLKIKKMNNIF